MLQRGALNEIESWLEITVYPTFQQSKWAPVLLCWTTQYL